MPDEAVLDSPAEGLDSSLTDTTSTDTGSGGDTGTSDGIDNNDSPQSGETGHLRGSELYKAVKEKLKGSQLTPQEQRSIRNAIHIAAKADEATGGDLTRFEAERQAYGRLAMDGEESLAPEELMETVRGDREQLAGILADIQAGGQKMIDELMTDSPESFKSMVPAAMDKLAQLDNARFSNYIAKSAVAYLDSTGIPVEWAVMDEFLPAMPDFPGKARLIQAIQKVYASYKGLSDIAAKSPEAPKVGKPSEAGTGDDREANLSQREFNITRTEWNRNAGSSNVSLRDSEVSRIASSRKITLTDGEKKNINAAIKDEFETRLAANRNYGQAMQDYIKKGNQRAYADRAASEGKKLLPSIVARHVNAEIEKRTAAAPKGTANPNGAKPNGQAAPVKDGSGNLIQWLSGHPKTLGKRVDLMRTSNSMLSRNEAYVVGEKQLFKWKARTN
jgi:hypothetical protein